MGGLGPQPAQDRLASLPVHPLAAIPLQDDAVAPPVLRRGDRSAWYALDGHRATTAAQHIDAATRLAALSRDPYALLHAWNSQGTTGLTTGRRADAEAEKLSTLLVAR
ncbi:hypothetical protein [Streptomyces luteireticuli]|uniref:hypothetical protein n=1 Tax=Streptomyces luteireticuli TaxID=173858 RepID=UPI0031CE45F5